MTDVAIQSVSSTITIADDSPAAALPQGAGSSPGFHDMEVARLKEILRPIIVDLLGEELARHRRMRG